VNIDDVLNVFSADVRPRLRSLLDNLGNGLTGRGVALREAFAELGPFLANAGRITAQLAERSSMTSQLIHNASVLTGVLGQRQLQLRQMVTYLGGTLTNLQAGSVDLDATLHALPPTLSALDSSFTAVRGVLGDVNTAVKSLYPVADNLPSSLAAIRALSASADPAVRALQQPVAKLVPFTQALRPIAANLAAAATTLRPQVPALDKTTIDLAKCKTGVQGFFQWDASISKFGDAAGPVPRGNLVLGLGTNALTSGPFEHFVPECSPGQPVGGRPATLSDMG
jgi:ABC-type transporter Mla subunit MlaD